MDKVLNVIFLSSWTWPIFRIGYHKDLEYDDLYTCSKYDESDLIGEKLQRLVVIMEHGHFT